MLQRLIQQLVPSNCKTAGLVTAKRRVPSRDLRKCTHQEIRNLTWACFVVVSCRYLTAREQRLRHRRKQLQDMMAWNDRLDEEEATVKKMEAALATRDDPKKPRGKDAAEKGKHKKVEVKDKGM